MLRSIGIHLQVVEVGGEAYEVTQQVEQAGHRSDIRTLCLSPDDQLLLSASNNSLKVGGWATGWVDGWATGLVCDWANTGRGHLVWEAPGQEIAETTDSA